MPRSLGNVIADSLQLSVGYAERLLKDVPAGQFARSSSQTTRPSSTAT